MLWLCIYLPLLPLQVFNASKKHAAPFAVIDRHRVLLCNESAQASGIEPGLTPSTAQALLHDQQHTLSTTERCMAREQTMLQELAETLYCFTPQITLHRKDSLLLEIGASLRLFDGLHMLQQKIRDQLMARELQHQQGIASTPRAAALFARYQYFCQQRGHYNNHATQLSLQDMPIALLELSKKTIEQCHDIGLQRLGELLRLPRDALAKRFSIETRTYLQQLTGERDDPQTSITLPETFTRERFYIDGLIKHDDLLAPMQQLLDELERYLQLRRLHSLGIQWTFQRFSKEKNALTVQVSEPQQSASIFLSLTRLQLNSIPLDSPVECITLHANHFNRVAPANNDFFSRQRNHRDASLLLDTLRTRLGAQALWQPHHDQQHLPESGLQHDEEKSSGKHSEKNKPVEPTSIPERPLWLLPQPETLTQQKNQLYWQGQTLQIVRGPERIESHWWETAIARDYFIALSGQQCLCWIYQDRFNKAWYLHGIFS